MNHTLSAYDHMNLAELEALCGHLQTMIRRKVDEQVPPPLDQFPVARHLSLLAAIETLVGSYRNLRYTLVFDGQRQLDKTSVKTPALQAFHTRMERLSAVIRLQRNTPLPPSLATSLSELKGIVYYRCLAGASLPAVIADDVTLFALLDHLMDTLDDLRTHVATH